MSRGPLAALIPAIALMAVVAAPGPAGATAIIKSFHFSICVTGAKNRTAAKMRLPTLALSSPTVKWKSWTGKSARPPRLWRSPVPAALRPANPTIDAIARRRRRRSPARGNGRRADSGGSLRHGRERSWRQFHGRRRGLRMAPLPGGGFAGEQRHHIGVMKSTAVVNRASVSTSIRKPDSR